MPERPLVVLLLQLSNKQLQERAKAERKKSSTGEKAKSGKKVNISSSCAEQYLEGMLDHPPAACAARCKISS